MLASLSIPARISTDEVVIGDVGDDAVSFAPPAQRKLWQRKKNSYDSSDKFLHTVDCATQSEQETVRRWTFSSTRTKDAATEIGGGEEKLSIP